MPDVQPVPEAVREAWEANSLWWDEHIGAEGNDFHRVLVAPAQLRLLDLQPGERVVEFACGNGQFAREMDRLGARVLATDFSAPFIDVAKQHSAATGQTLLDFRVVDATDEAALLALAEPHTFDAAVCTMAIHDIQTLDPLMRAVNTLLKPCGRFVFSVTHPAFNHSGVIFENETEDVGGEVVVRYAIKMRRYLHGGPETGIGIMGQPKPH
jgi:2-polyprenyl-3-methyl-5-hydroxy-6-metoxy-1,4-benzoquinol methylase